MSQSIAEILWQENKDLAIACLNHPFVRGIGDGRLSHATFAYYVGQDAFFLEAFARAYSIAAAKADDWEGFSVFHALADGVLAELKLHHSYAQKWGVDLQAVRPGAATRQYTDFLLATAWGQAAGVTATAMLPCMKLYAFLGKSLAQAGIPDHDYADWIATYSSDEFEPLVQQLEQLTEKYSRLSLTTRSTYRYAMQCELDFFEGALRAGAGASEPANGA